MSNPFPEKTMRFYLENCPERGGIPDRSTGIRAYSLLLKCNTCQAFDIVRDTPCDVMHHIALGVVYKTNELCFNHVKLYAGKREIVLQRMDVVRNARTPYLRGRRYPDDPFQRLGNWKADEHQTFSQIYFEYVMEGLLPPRLRDLAIIMRAIVRIFYDYTRIHGWTTEAVEKCRKLCASWYIRYIAVVGEGKAIVDHMFGVGHIFDDIQMFGHHTVMWCYMHERYFAVLNRIPTNNKQVEITLSRVINMGFFSNIIVQRVEDSDGKTPAERWLTKMNAASKDSTFGSGYLQTKSQAAALELANKTHWCPLSTVGQQKGICCGRATIRRLANIEKRALLAYGYETMNGISVSCYQSIYIADTLFTKEDNVVVRGENQENHYLGRLKYIIAVPTDKGTAVFFSAEYYRHSYVEDESTGENVQEVDRRGLHVLVPGMVYYDHQSILPVDRIVREIMILPMRDQSRYGHKLVLETRTDEIPDDILHVGGIGLPPVWPLVDDIVEIQASTNAAEDVWYARVLDVYKNDKVQKVKVQWLEEEDNKLVLGAIEHKLQHWDCIVRRCKYRTLDDGNVFELL